MDGEELVPPPRRSVPTSALNMAAQLCNLLDACLGSSEGGNKLDGQVGAGLASAGCGVKGGAKTLHKDPLPAATQPHPDTCTCLHACLRAAAAAGSPVPVLHGVERGRAAGAAARRARAHALRCAAQAAGGHGHGGWRGDSGPHAALPQPLRLPAQPGGRRLAVVGAVGAWCSCMHGACIHRACGGQGCPGALSPLLLGMGHAPQVGPYVPPLDGQFRRILVPTMDTVRSATGA